MFGIIVVFFFIETGETAIEKILDANAYLLSKSWMLGDIVVSFRHLAHHTLSLFFSSSYQSAYQSFHCFSLSFSWLYHTVKRSWKS